MQPHYWWRLPAGPHPEPPARTQIAVAGTCHTNLLSDQQYLKPGLSQPITVTRLSNNISLVSVLIVITVTVLSDS